MASPHESLAGLAERTVPSERSCPITPHVPPCDLCGADAVLRRYATSAGAVEVWSAPLWVCPRGCGVVRRARPLEEG